MQGLHPSRAPCLVPPFRDIRIELLAELVVPLRRPAPYPTLSMRLAKAGMVPLAAGGWPGQAPHAPGAQPPQQFTLVPVPACGVGLLPTHGSTPCSTSADREPATCLWYAPDSSGSSMQASLPGSAASGSGEEGVSDLLFSLPCSLPPAQLYRGGQCGHSSGSPSPSPPTQRTGSCLSARWRRSSAGMGLKRRMSLHVPWHLPRPCLVAAEAAGLDGLEW